ncbi:unnamed protein product [Ilex paraguariensis]|uniref:Uncharacterized protein n=1 Tax=Ilex paraguariensis TaxID=185542 RepID=A0ABC8TVX3_9AQUA
MKRGISSGSTLEVSAKEKKNGALILDDNLKGLAMGINGNEAIGGSNSLTQALGDASELMGGAASDTDARVVEIGKEASAIVAGSCALGQMGDVKVLSKASFDKALEKEGDALGREGDALGLIGNTLDVIGGVYEQSGDAHRANVLYIGGDVDENS